MQLPRNYIRNPLWILILILHLVQSPITAQSGGSSQKTIPVRFEHYGEDQDINNNITCIFQDHLGYLWFGDGPEGLCRFDGYEFDHYQNIEGDTSSLPQNLVATIFAEDHSGNLWLASGGAITRYNRATNDFSRNTRLKNSVEWATWASISSVAVDREGNVWIGAYGNPGNPQSGGLIMISAETGRITHYKNDSSISSSLISNCVSQLYVDGAGTLWVGTCGMGIDRFVPGPAGEPGTFIHYRNRLEDPNDFIRTTVKEIADDGAGSVWFITAWNEVLRYDQKGDRIRRYRIDAESRTNRNTKLVTDGEGGIWIGTTSGLARYDKESDSFRLYVHQREDPFSIPRGTIADLDIGHDGFIWLIIHGDDPETGLTQFDPDTEKFHVYRHKKDQPWSLSTNILNTSLVDRNGILWIASAEGGLNKYDPHKYKFNTLFSVLSEQQFDYPERVQSLCLDHRDRLWIGTRGNGLYRYDRKTGITDRYPLNPADPGGLKSGIIWSIIEHPPGILWIGGDSGLNRLDTRTMEWNHFWPDPEYTNYFGPNYIRDLCPDSSGILWIATMHGSLVSFDMESRQFRFHEMSEQNPGGVHSTGLMSVFLDGSGTVWTGSIEGLDRYLPGNGVRRDTNTYYWHDPLKPHYLGASMVGGVCFDRTGDLWVATAGGGLNRLDTASGEFVHYTTRKGLISNIITELWTDGSGMLWLGSFSGLGKFDPVTGGCITYNRSEGLPSREITQGSGFISEKGEIFFAGPGGITFFHPDSLVLNDHVPPVVLTHIRLFDEPLLPGEDGKLELGHDENFLSFEFAALNYTNSHRNQYRYRMIGLDPDTVFAGIRRTASYTDMKPGRYTFWVTGSNNDGVWNPEGTSLEIVIRPPWSGSILAIAIYVFLCILALLGIIRWRIWKLTKDRRILEQQVKERTRVIEEKDRHILEMDRMKTRFFANVSHEFRTPLTLIISPLEDLIARRKPGDPERRILKTIRRNGHRLLSLVNQLLDLSKLDSGNLKQDLVESDVVRILKLTCASFLSLAEKNRIRFNCHLPKEEYITFFDKEKLETILNNLLSNAFKYTPGEGIIECYAQIEESNDPSVRDQGTPRLTISVIDSGPGIERDKLMHVFDRFYQGDESHHTEGGGSGIGLSITKELVELIHGDISVNSEPGEGCCFMVSIPLGKDHLTESEFVIKEQPRTPASTYSAGLIEEEYPETDNLSSAEPIHLLIVEDNNDLRTYLKEQLKNEYTIVEGETGEKGLKRALKVIPDLVVTDVMMPGMDGIELCHRLKSNERTSHIPVIILTAKADFDSRISGLETGADDYILKPFQIKELRTRIRNLIRQRNMLRERFSGNVDTIAEDIRLNSYDVRFIRRVTEVVEDHLPDFEFDVGRLQEKSGLSHTQLYRKLHALTGLSPSRFIRHLRLKRAQKMLEQSKGSVTQVAFEVGFGNLSYFTKCFREEFGISPSEYSRQNALHKSKPIG